MFERSDLGASIERIENLSIVSLKLTRKFSESARHTLQLASSAKTAGVELQSLWLGPDRWLLVSNSSTSDEIIAICEETLTGVLHNAVDYSAGLSVLRIVGPNARQLLESGSGVDFRPAKFPARSCCRTRFAQIAAVIVADAPEVYDIYIDRSYETYLIDWLVDSASIHCSHLN